jgi:hypothetical protein
MTAGTRMANLLIWDLKRQKIRRVLRGSRQVVSCQFTDSGDALELGFRPATDEDHEDAGTVVLEGRVERSDWPTNEEWLDGKSLELTMRREGESESTAANELEALAQEQGVPWVVRGGIWGIGWAGDDITACGPSLAFERWSREGSLLASHGDDRNGVQLSVVEDKALVSLNKLDLVAGEGFVNRGGVAQFDLSTNERSDPPEVDYSVAMASDAAGNVLFRQAKIRPPFQEGRDHIRFANGELSKEFDIGEYDCFNHYLPAFNADQLYAIQTWPERKEFMDPIKKWVCRVDPESLQVSRLFPHEWNAERNAHLFSHGGCYVEHEGMRGLVLLTAVHHYDARHPVEGLVTLRELPDGQARWEQPVAAEMSWVGHMADAGVVIVATADFRVLVYSIATGELVQEEVAGHPHPRQVLLSGAVNGNQVAFGTIDGSILLYEWE